MLIKLYNDNTNHKDVLKIVDILKSGGIVVYPTDSVYGLGCDINNQKSAERIAKLKGTKLEKANFSFIFDDLSHLSDYTRPINNYIYKVMKRNLPGPFTFILDANNNVPKIFKSKKKTIGIRIPDNNIIRKIVEELGNPIMTTSVHDDDEIVEYITDPELIYENFKDKVDIVVDGGYGNNVASTVVNCVGDEIDIIRQGVGELDL